MGAGGIITYDNIYTDYIPSDIDKIVNIYIKNQKIIKTYGKIEYINAPAAYDIETSSFYQDSEKKAIMYCWALGLNGAVILGRTWEEFLKCLDRVATLLSLGHSRRLIIYVHNLGFEFQFFRRWLEWDFVFASREREPIYAVTSGGIEFRDSYILSGYKLETLGKMLHKYPVKKMVGDLDYNKIRHSYTPMTPKEKKYSGNDVRVVMSYIAEQIEREGNITKIPLTNTGYVRRYCRNACLYERRSHKYVNKYQRYRALMDQLIICPEEYKLLKEAFQGGFTHANAFYTGRIMQNITSYDIASSYPTVMIAERFPMTRGEFVDIKTKSELLFNLQRYCLVFEVVFEGLESVILWEHPISYSKCYDSANVVLDNGRVVTADRVCMTITDIDFIIYDKFYTWRKMKIGRCIRYGRGYLPTDFVKSIVYLYKRKTELKGIAGREEEYQNIKGKINSCYGMTVTDIFKPEIIYDDEWSIKNIDLAEKIAKENKNRRRFLFYPWGVFVTAYAREKLFDAIYNLGADYVYSDTDSVKLRHADKHTEYFGNYNNNIRQKLTEACSYHGIDPADISPKNKNGVSKPLGVWEKEYICANYKTLGAKRYMTEIDGTLSMTVSGVNKNNAIPYLTHKYKNNIDIMQKFNDGLEIPPGYTGKLTHTYIDDPIQGSVTDYLGSAGIYYERSGVHLEEAGYNISLSDSYIDYIRGLEEMPFE